MLLASKIIERFDLNILNKDVAVLDREINTPAIHRSGLELSGMYKMESTNSHVIGWGTKERKFLNTLSVEQRREALERVLTEDIPIVLLSVGFKESKEVIKTILEICNEHKIPLILTNEHRAELVTTIGWYIVKYLAPTQEIHASLIKVNGVGVAIMGKSGIGKSEAVLELIQKGHRFISDDTIVMKKIGTDFIGEAAPLTKNFLEARGIGLIDIPKIYGLQSVDDSSRVSLVVELLPSEMLNDVDRLGNSELKFEILGGAITKIQIPVQNGRTLSALIEAAVNVYIARRHGHDPLNIISERSN